MSTSKSSGTVSRNLAIVKQYFKKPLTLVVAIFSLVTLAAQFMWSTTVSKMGDEFAAAITAMTGQEGQAIPAGSSSLTFILSGIITLCIFMIFIFSLTPNGGPTIWFSILHALSVIQLILNALAALIVVVFEIVFIFATPMLVQFVANSDNSPLGTMTDEQIEALTRQVSSFRITLIIGMVITLVIYGVYLYYINSQTAFLKSVTLTCKNPMLKYKGAVPYGNLSIAIAVLQLIGIVIFYLMVGNAETSIMGDLEVETPYDLTLFSSLIKPYLIFSISSALYIFLRGYAAKGWEAFAKENEHVLYETAGASARHMEAAPMETYKANNRSSNEARQQSQPYLIGEEEDPNKKSSYIPEELQSDFNDPQPQMYGQGNPYGGQQFGGNPYGGNPYGQPAPGGQNPYGGDPFAQSPMGGQNPYGGDPFAQSPMGGQNPYGGNQGGGYNNGMM